MATAQVVVTRGRDGLEPVVGVVDAVIASVPGVVVTGRVGPRPRTRAGRQPVGDGVPAFTITVEADDEALSALHDALGGRAELVTD